MIIQDHDFTMGKLTSLLVLLHNNEAGELIKKQLNMENCRYTVGSIGSIDLNKVISVIEASAETKGIINSDSYNERNTLYHTILEAVQGVGRGTIQVGDLLKKVDLTYGIVRGKNKKISTGNDWIGVCIYGRSDSEEKGIEQETLGLGFNHL